MDFILILVFALIALGTGAAFLLIGYRFFLHLLPLWGFLAGFWLGAQTIDWLFGWGFLASIPGLLAGLFAGLILGFLSYLFYAIGVVLLGASFGFWFGTAIVYIIGVEPGFIATLVGIVSALSFAGLTVLLDVKKHLVVIITAFGGASSFLIGLWLLLGTLSPSEIQAGAAQGLASVIDQSLIWLLIWLLLAILGILYQEHQTRGFFVKYDRQYD